MPEFQSNLTNYITNPKKTQLKRYMNYDDMNLANAYEKSISLLCKDFDHNILLTMPPELILEVVSFIASIYDYVCDSALDELKDYLTESKDYCLVIQKRYREDLENVTREISRYSHEQTVGLRPPYYNKETRQELGYTKELMEHILEHQGIHYKYYQYVEGYYAARNRLYSWLASELEYCLSDLDNLQEVTLDKVAI